MTVFLAGVRLQLWWVRTNADELQSFAITPLFTVLLGAVVNGVGRPDLFPGSVLGAGLIGAWMMCTQVGGNIIQHARWSGTFEGLVSTPAAVPLIIAGRVAVVVGVTVLLFPEAWLTAWLVFGVAVPVPHPVVLVATSLVTLVGLHGAATLVAGLCVLGRRPFVLQLALTYPFYLLSGLVVPVSALPHWLQPLSRLVFLSWGADLLRATLLPAVPADLPRRLVALAITCIAIVLAAFFVLLGVLRRASVRGTLNLV
jgi:ABC-2 type transport system permease protein